jgi:hypothetical protein
MRPEDTDDAFMDFDDMDELYPWKIDDYIVKGDSLIVMSLELHDWDDGGGLEEDAIVKIQKYNMVTEFVDWS